MTPISNRHTATLTPRDVVAICAGGCVGLVLVIVGAEIVGRWRR